MHALNLSPCQPCIRGTARTVQRGPRRSLVTGCGAQCALPGSLGPALPPWRPAVGTRSMCQAARTCHSCSWTALALCGAGTASKSEGRRGKHLRMGSLLDGLHPCRVHTQPSQTHHLDSQASPVSSCVLCSLKSVMFNAGNFELPCTGLQAGAACLERLDTVASSLDSFPSHLHTEYGECCCRCQAYTQCKALQLGLRLMTAEEHTKNVMIIPKVDLQRAYREP